MTKVELRIKHLALRKELGALKLKTLSESIITQVLPLIRDVQSLGIYVSQPFEVDTRVLIETCLEQGKIVCVPKIVGSKMIFVQIKSLDECKPGVMGILEPISNESYPQSIDCMIIPMLAYNARTYRLGYGKGYYDGYLKDYQGMKIGLCFAFDAEESLVEESHDIACERIITN